MAPSTRPETVRSPDGTLIAYWSTGAGPPILLVHGAMSDHRRWRIVERLAAHRSVHAMDRRGRGGSGDADEWSLERETEDVAAVVDALAAKAGPVDVLGHSLGGLLSLRAASLTSHMRRLVLYEPAVVETAQPADIVDRMRRALDEGRDADVVETMMREVVLMPEAEIVAMKALPSWPTRVATAATLPRELSVDLVWDRAEGSRLSLPVRVLQGGDSPEFMKRGCRRVVENVPGAELVVIEGQQHVADQLQPDGFADLVIDFVTAPA